MEEPEKENKEIEIKEMNKKGKEGSLKPLFFILILSFAMVFLWDSFPFIKNAVHYVLDPTAGFLLSWNLLAGMSVIVAIITFITTLAQKYLTDQEALRELKKEQKLLQEQQKQFREHPEKMAELSKKQMELIPKTFKLTSRPILFTGIPFILFFRWFSDVFIGLGNPKFLGFLNWFWFYLIFSLILGSIFRKILKVV